MVYRRRPGLIVQESHVDGFSVRFGQGESFHQKKAAG
jgi:hypothetical protein